MAGINSHHNNLEMGKVIVLTLATVGSCAALSSGGGSNLSGRRISSSSSRSMRIRRHSINNHLYHPHLINNNNLGGSSSTPSSTIVTLLQYREIDEDQSPGTNHIINRLVDDSNDQNEVTLASSSTPTRNSKAASSRANNTNNNNIHTINPISMLPISSSRAPTKADKEQLAMDQYLEYVERRYRRINQKPYTGNNSNNNRSQQQQSRQHQQQKKSRQQQQLIRPPRIILDMQLPRKIFMATLSLHKIQPLSPFVSSLLFGCWTNGDDDDEDCLVLSSSSSSSQQPNSPSVTSSNPWQHLLSNINNNNNNKETQEEEEEETEDDALKTLGLHTLASPNLRQRLKANVPREFRDEYRSAINFIHHLVSISDNLNEIQLALVPGPAGGGGGVLNTGGVGEINKAMGTGGVGKGGEVADGRIRTNSASNVATTKADDMTPSSSSAVTSSLTSKKKASSPTTTTTKEIINRNSYTSINTTLSFTLQFKLLLQTIHQLTMAFISTTRVLSSFIKRLCTQILDVGGFQHSVRIMSVVPLVVMVAFKPLFRGMMEQQAGG